MRLKFLALQELFKKPIWILMIAGRLNPIPYLAILFFFIGSPIILGGSPPNCESILPRLAAEKAEIRQAQSGIDSWEGLLRAFSEGLLPDLTEANQIKAFKVYLQTNFGSSEQMNDVEKQVNDVVDFLKNHPKLTKEPFRSYRLVIDQVSYPVTEEVSNLMRDPLDAVARTKGNFYQIEANLGFWKRIFNWEEANPPSDFSTEQMKEFSQKEKARFLSFLDRLVTPEQRELISDRNEVSELAKVNELKKFLRALKKERSKMLKKERDVSQISHAMIELVHLLGFQAVGVQPNLKSSDGLKRLESLTKALQERDRISTSIGFENYHIMLKEFKLSSVMGGEPQDSLLKRIKLTETKLAANPVLKKEETNQKVVRQMSLLEAPFRSCVGRDCSSNTYLYLALDPAWQYFSLTDSNGKSDGHVTVVLGTLPANKTNSNSFPKSKKKQFPVAFIDKVQNVPRDSLPLMLEAIRRSLREKGYTLVLPEDLGEHNGISNSLETTEFIRDNIKTEKKRLAGFEPYPGPYLRGHQGFEDGVPQFWIGFSRAENQLKVKIISPLKIPVNAALEPLPEVKPWKSNHVDLQSLLLNTHQKKLGSLEDKLRYIGLQHSLKTNQMESDPDFNVTLDRWLSDPATPFKLKKRSVLYKWLEAGKKVKLSSLLHHFTPAERIDFIQNGLDTPRLEAEFLYLSDLPRLLVAVRGNKKLTKRLAAGISNSEIIQRLLTCEDLPDEKALSAVQQILELSESQLKINGVLKLIRTVRGSSAEPEVTAGLAKTYVNNVFDNPKQLALEIVSYKNSRGEAARDFYNAMADYGASKDPTNLAMLALKELGRLENQLKLSYPKTVAHWLTDPTVSPMLKSAYLKNQLLSPDLENLLKHLPKDQIKEVRERLEEGNFASLFKNLAQKKELTSEAVMTSPQESYEFVLLTPPETGREIEAVVSEGNGGWQFGAIKVKNKFEIQASPVTMEQWASIMESKPGKKRRDNLLEVNGWVASPSDSVRAISWNDAQRFIEKLNGMDPSYRYRLPTAVEWAYASEESQQHGLYYMDGQNFEWNQNGPTPGKKYFSTAGIAQDGMERNNSRFANVTIRLVREKK